MGDLYVEHLVKRKTPSYLTAVRILLYAVCGGLLVIGLMVPLLIVVPVIAIALTIFVTKRFNVEYEYLYVNGDLDFDAIMSASKRKKKLSVSVHELEIMAPAGFAELKQYDNKRDMKVYDFSSMTNSKDEYVMIMMKDEKWIKVIFEPTKEIIDGMKMMAPRKVLLKW